MSVWETLADPRHPIWKALQAALSIAALVVIAQHYHSGEHLATTGTMGGHLDSDDVIAGVVGLKTLVDLRHFIWSNV